MKFIIERLYDILGVPFKDQQMRYSIFISLSLSLSTKKSDLFKRECSLNNNEISNSAYLALKYIDVKA